MSDSVQITLIICFTIISCYIMSCFKHDPKSKERDYDNERFGYCKSPTYPKSPRPGSGIK